METVGFRAGGSCRIFDCRFRSIERGIVPLECGYRALKVLSNVSLSGNVTTLEGCLGGLGFNLVHHLFGAWTSEAIF